MKSGVKDPALLKKVLLEIGTVSYTIVPLLIGIGTILAYWFGLKTDILLYIGLAGLIMAGTTFGVNLFGRGGHFAEKVKARQNEQDLFLHTSKEKEYDQIAQNYSPQLSEKIRSANEHVQVFKEAVQNSEDNVASKSFILGEVADLEKKLFYLKSLIAGQIIKINKSLGNSTRQKIYKRQLSIYQQQLDQINTRLPDMVDKLTTLLASKVDAVNFSEEIQSINAEFQIIEETQEQVEEIVAR